MNLSEDLKKVVLAGIGAAAVTFEKARILWTLWWNGANLLLHRVR